MGMTNTERHGLHNYWQGVRLRVWMVAHNFPFLNPKFVPVCSTSCNLMVNPLATSALEGVVHGRQQPAEMGLCNATEQLGKPTDIGWADRGVHGDRFFFYIFDNER